MMSWEQLYDYFGIRDFIYFISSFAIQDQLLPAKIVFILFTLFFLVAVIYFYAKSSYLKYNFLEDVVEFFSWQSYGSREANKHWQKIAKIIESGNESQYKLAIVEADDFLYKTLEDRGYEGDTFEELLENSRKKMLPEFEDILFAHQIRNSIIYDSDYKLDLEVARRVLNSYEKAIKNA